MTVLCGADTPVRAKWICRWSAGVLARKGFWVAQCFSAAINVVFLLGALAPEGEHAQ